MVDSFLTRYHNLESEVKSYLNFTIGAMREVVFYDQKQEEDEGVEDIFYDLPCLPYYGKHNTATDYRIVKAGMDGDKVVFIGESDEGYGTEEFHLGYIHLHLLIELASLIESGNFVKNEGGV